ncbi:hypothetical protein [Cognatishimia sp.]|uniref:hypothetical protein n=1 Tax=Cognatishimia sp. TaxID=2211648 RepID=UPI00351266C2|nr:hypothetical protein [Cognatishimia sp.]
MKIIRLPDSIANGIALSEYEAIESIIGQQRLADLSNICAEKYPFHNKAVGKVTLHEKVSTVPFPCIARAEYNVEIDDFDYYVEYLDILTTLITGKEYTDLEEAHEDYTDARPVFDFKYDSIDPICYDILPNNLEKEGKMYYKHMDARSYVNYICYTDQSILFDAKQKDLLDSGLLRVDYISTALETVGTDFSKVTSKAFAVSEILSVVAEYYTSELLQHIDEYIHTNSYALEP